MPDHHIIDGKVYEEGAGQTKLQLQKERTRRQGKLAAMQQRYNVTLPGRIADEEATIAELDSKIAEL